LRRHGEQGDLVRGGQAGAIRADADGLADAEFFPQTAGGQHDGEFKDGVDLDLGNRSLAAGRQGVGSIGIDDAVDAGEQTLQGGAVELIGPAEAVDDAGFRALGLGVPVVFGEGIVGDGGSIAVSPLGDAQIQT
jgi:hypothetical protein